MRLAMFTRRNEIRRDEKNKMILARTCERLRGMSDDPLLSDCLRPKAIRGGAWLGTGSVAEQALRFARNMFLARILAPGAFGKMAIVLCLHRSWMCSSMWA
jgi:hypothetical protein